VAKCNFGINLGDKYPDEFEKNFGPIIGKESLHYTYFEANDICKSNAYNDIIVEFTFLFGELASIKMIAMNDEKNTPTNKLILMKYAKSNYGKFDTGLSADNYNDFNVWERNNYFVVYKRMINEKKIWEEEIYISNDKYDEQLIVEKNSLEESYIKEIIE
tara:strand:- start:1664 stop:2143 length:480 start_codon:yes stop_codon:yes gene_type:complete